MRDVERRWTDLDGPVHYLEYEGPSDGPTFVCVHGLGGSHVNWIALAPMLADHGRVLVPDLAGFGYTPLESRTAHVQANRMLLDRFIETIVGEPVILLGNSMGGVISLLQADARPESVAGLVLVDPALPRSLGQPVDRAAAALFAAYMIPRVGDVFLARRVATLGAERIAEQTLDMCTVDRSRVPREVIDASLALARERVATMPWATTAFLQAARSLVRLLARRQRIYRIVRDVAAPTLMLMGRHDRLVPLAAAQLVATMRPDWDFVVFDDLGHVPQLEDPAGTMREIERWLTGPAARLLTGTRALER